MDAFIESLLEELNCEAVFVIPVLGGIPVLESVVVTWIIMAVLTLASIVLVRNLKVENAGRKQLMLEAVVGGLYQFFDNSVGHRGRKYIPYLISVSLYIGIANLMGLFGFKPPTKDINVTIGLAFISIMLIEVAGFRQKGLKGWLKAFAKPIPVMLPINILELFIRPLSLCMRLFGNVLGAFVVMELIKLLIPAVVPVAFSLYFDIFDGLIQAYVFVFLTSLFVGEALEE